MSLCLPVAGLGHFCPGSQKRPGLARAVSGATWTVAAALRQVAPPRVTLAFPGQRCWEFELQIHIQVSEFVSFEELSLVWLLRLVAPVSGCTLWGPAQILCLVATEPLRSGSGGERLDTHSPLAQQGGLALPAPSATHAQTRWAAGCSGWEQRLLRCAADSRLCRPTLFTFIGKNSYGSGTVIGMIF